MIPQCAPVLSLAKGTGGHALRSLFFGFLLAAILPALPQAALAQGTHGCATRGAVPDSASNPGLVRDCETLIGIKGTLRGMAPLNWSAGLPMSSWEGISVESTHGGRRVTRISLIRKGLNGHIPPQLGNLSYLRYLNLLENRLSGTIPSPLGNLLHLDYLVLSNNRLSGSIPSELGNLVNLRFLSISGNSLSGPIPAALGSLNRLESLELSLNETTGPIPATFGNLTNLRYLFLSDASLSGAIPGTLGNLANLRELRVDGNQLSASLPAELGNLASLEFLDASRNNIGGSIPRTLGNLTNLRFLHLQDNALTGTIPRELGNLAYLESLRLQRNRLSGSIPSELGNLGNLGYLRLNDNLLSGAIPPELSNLANLEVLHLQNNLLSGPVPAAFVNLVSLRNFKFQGNQISGDAPTEFASVSELSGDKLYVQRHDVPGATLELGIGWVSRDGSRVILVGVIRDQTLGQTYYIARVEGSPRVVRRWISPASSLVYSVNWPVVNTQFTVPVEIIRTIELDERLPEPNMLVRRFDGGDERIFAYDASIQQWRHIPDWPTFQALGFYWCDVTAADATFFQRIREGPPYPATTMPAQDFYPNCRT